MKQHYYILLRILVGSMLTGCSSSKVDCTATIKSITIGGDWSGYNSSHRCPAYRFKENGKMYEPLSTMDDNHISLANPDCITAIEKAKAYIEKRGGIAFLQATFFESISVTYADKYEELRKIQSGYDLEKCGDTKYYVRFMFSPQPNIQYRMGFAMNDVYQVISPLEFPEANQNPNFQNIISPLDAYKIAQQKHCKLVENAEIELDYDQERNRFVWIITGESKDLKPTNERSTRRDFEYGFVCINASTSAILIAGKRKGYALINPRYF